MLLGMISVLVCVSGASFDSFDMSKPRLWLCAGLDAGLEFPTTPHQHCVEVDVCEQKNQRAEPLVRGNWTHRSAAALHVAHDSSEGVFARYSIDAVRVPAGVVLELCEPDFAELRASGLYVCNERTVQSVVGNCADATDSDADENTCWVHPSLAHTAQLARYSFDTAWGCHVSAEPGFTLSSPDVPNRLVACDAVAHSSYDTDCVIQCDNGYTLTDGVCVHQCVGLLEYCESLEYANHTCTAAGVQWYDCAPCPLEPGSSVVAFNARSAPSECIQTECAAGSFGTDGTCQPCAPHSYSLAAQSACTPCLRGEFQPTPGSSECMSCFPTQASAPTCPDGHELYQTMSSIDVYFQEAHSAKLQVNDPEDAALLLSYCAQGHACLPCQPGQYELRAECKNCPVGTYQPHYEATTCFNCSAGQTTADSGATSSDECICVPGFQLYST